MQVLFVEVSQNAKTGPIPASIVERVSCWPGCALYENGCYAENGALALHWDRVSRGLAGGSWSEFCAVGRDRHSKEFDLQDYSPSGLLHPDRLLPAGGVLRSGKPGESVGLLSRQCAH